MATTTTTSASSSNLGKKPTKWYFTDDEIMHLPSRKTGMDAASELRGRREAAEFIQEMAEKLNHNVPANRGQINQNCICIAMVHMHRFYVVHPISLFQPKDVAAACLFMAGKSEECPRKLEHIVEVWFRLKHKKEAQPPFNETTRKNGADLIVFLEQILLQTIGFDLHVSLPHPIVIQNMQKFKLDNKKLIKCAYWFATDIIQLTNWCIRYTERTIACVCVNIACSWADYEIPETAGTPWFKQIDPEMTEELLNKLTDEFTRVYEVCTNSHARSFIQKAKNGNPSTMPVKAIAQLPPPPPPPVLQQQQSPRPKDVVVDGQQKQPTVTDGGGFEPTAMKAALKRSPRDEHAADLPVAKKFSAVTKTTTHSRVIPLERNSTTTVPSRPPTSGEQQVVNKAAVQVKQETAAFSPASSANKKPPTAGEEAAAALAVTGVAPPNKKKIGLSEYKQRLLKQEPPSDSSPASQATPPAASVHGYGPMDISPMAATTAAASGQQQAGAMDGVEPTVAKRQSFIPDFSNASVAVIGAEALELPVGIPMVEEKKKREKDQHQRTTQQQQTQQNVQQRHEYSHNNNSSNSSTAANSSAHHHRHRSHEHRSGSNSKELNQQQRSHQQHHQHVDQQQRDNDSRHKSHHRERDSGGASTKIYLNGGIERHKQREREQQRRSTSIGIGNNGSEQKHHAHREREQQRGQWQQQQVLKDMKQEKHLPLDYAQPPPPPYSPNGNGAPSTPPPPPPEDGNATAVELEEGELV